MISLNFILSILKSGGNVVINANDFTVFSMTAMAQATKLCATHLTIKGAKKLSLTSIQAIVSINPGHVTIDASEQ